MLCPACKMGEVSCKRCGHRVVLLSHLRALPLRERFFLMEELWRSIFERAPDLAFRFRRMVLAELGRWAEEPESAGTVP
jgi:hypothetical protein